MMRALSKSGTAAHPNDQPLTDAPTDRRAVDRAPCLPWFSYYLYRRTPSSADRTLSRRRPDRSVARDRHRDRTYRSAAGTLSSDQPLAGAEPTTLPQVERPKRTLP